MAHKKALGSAKKNKDSAGRRLGVKIYGNQNATPGSIIIRQRGTKFRPGENVTMGKDHTIAAKIAGLVNFRKKRLSSFTGTEKNVFFVDVKTK